MRYCWGSEIDFTLYALALASMRLSDCKYGAQLSNIITCLEPEVLSSISPGWSCSQEMGSELVSNVYVL
jgi:hypothetical protein